MQGNRKTKSEANALYPEDKNYIRPKLCVFDLVGWFPRFCFQSV